jgi:DNA repair exonuclease SbcCD nuclease subunit
MQSDLFDFDKCRVKVLGDPHLGRSFLNGVPLARRGDREKLQWADFEASLFNLEGAHVHVCMGDLFDRWAVPYEVIWRCAAVYREAHRKRPGVRYVVLQGNHDASKDLTKVSAFKIFTGLVDSFVTVVRDEPLRLRDLGLTFIPWDPVINAAEMVEKHKDLIAGSTAVFGHWDIVAVGETSNLLPVDLLHTGCNVEWIITGHEHTRRMLKYNDRPVVVTGSMQPYSFAEDTEGKLYVTHTLDEVKAALAADADAFAWKNLRIQLKAGETLTETINCLQLKLVPADAADEEQESVGEVEFEVFKFEDLFAKALADNGVSADFIELAKQRWDAERVKG